MKITVAQRQAVTALLEAGTDTSVIAAQVGVTPGQVAAVKAHVTMGSYDDVSEAIEAAVTEVVDSAFGLEKDLSRRCGAISLSSKSGWSLLIAIESEQLRRAGSI